MIYLLDDDQLAVLKRVETRLYNEMTRLTADDRRDLANAMNAVRTSVENLGDVDDELDRRVKDAERAAFDRAIAYLEPTERGGVIDGLKRLRDGEA